MSTGERYSKLLEIAKETSSERRRELLHEVTDLFFETGKKTSKIESELFGDLMAKVAFELNTEFRKEFAERFGDNSPPRTVAVALANDEIEIAYPILKSATTLTDDDLIKIVTNKDTNYQIGVAERTIVSERVSEALVDHGNDEVLEVLIKNDGAIISNNTYEKVVVRAEKNHSLHAPLVNRKAVPADILDEMFGFVSAPMRAEITKKFQDIPEEEINAAMKRAANRVKIFNGALPEDFETATAELVDMKVKGTINRAQLPTIWRDNKKTLFKLILADFGSVDYYTIERIIQNCDADSLAIICRANNFERALFVTICALSFGSKGINGAEALGHLYNEVPPEAASRAIRFMQVKTSALKQAA